MYGNVDKKNQTRETISVNYGLYSTHHDAVVRGRHFIINVKSIEQIQFQRFNWKKKLKKKFRAHLTVNSDFQWIDENKTFHIPCIEKFRIFSLQLSRMASV